MKQGQVLLAERPEDKKKRLPHESDSPLIFLVIAVYFTRMTRYLLVLQNICGLVMFRTYILLAS